MLRFMAVGLLDELVMNMMMYYSACGCVDLMNELGNVVLWAGAGFCWLVDGCCCGALLVYGMVLWRFGFGFVGVAFVC